MRRLLPIRLFRPVILLFLRPDSNEINALILISFRLAPTRARAPRRRLRQGARPTYLAQSSHRDSAAMTEQTAADKPGPSKRNQRLLDIVAHSVYSEKEISCAS